MTLPATLRRPRRLSSRTEDLIFKGTVAFLGLGVLGLAVGIGLSLAGEAGPALGRFGPGFFARSVWDPVREDFGVLPHIYGTLVTSLLALLLGGPVALGTAVFLAEFAPGWVRNPVSYLVELLAAVPSVVYGLWGLFVLAPLLRTTVQPALGNWLGFLPLFQGPYYGVGIFTGGLILAIMVIPTMAAVSRDVIRAVPDDQREAMLALGATRWETVRYAVLPAARSGIVGAVLLGLGRALGETMAVTMVIGNRPEIPASLFGPGYTMAAVIANEFAEATSDLHLSALFAVGFGLFVLTLPVNIAARVLVWRVAWGPVGGE